MNACSSRWIVACLLVAVISPSAFAQAPWRAAHFDVAVSAMQSATRQPTSDYRMIVGGLVGGALGFLAGGIAGAVINDTDNTEDDLAAVRGFVLGAAIGETIVLPLGVNIANYRQGNYMLSLLAAAAITGVGIAIATSGEDRLELLIPVPLLQLWSSILIEKRTTN